MLFMKPGCPAEHNILLHCILLLSMDCFLLCNRFIWRQTTLQHSRYFWFALRRHYGLLPSICCVLKLDRKHAFVVTDYGRPTTLLFYRTICFTNSVVVYFYLFGVMQQDEMKMTLWSNLILTCYIIYKLL